MTREELVQVLNAERLITRRQLGGRRHLRELEEASMGWRFGDRAHTKRDGSYICPWSSFKPPSKRELQLRRQAEFVEDVEWLLDSGCGWAEISNRLDLGPKAIARRLYRYGRPDLARIFDGQSGSAAA